MIFPDSEQKPASLPIAAAGCAVLFTRRALRITAVRFSPKTTLGKPYQFSHRDWCRGFGSGQLSGLLLNPSFYHWIYRFTKRAHQKMQVGRKSCWRQLQASFFRLLCLIPTGFPVRSVDMQRTTDNITIRQGDTAIIR